MNPRARFQKMANEVRLIIPESDDPFWNFYRNTLSGGDPQPIAIRIVFKREGQAAAEAEFRCLPSPHQLAWLALDRTLAAHPRLRWDMVAINNGPEYSRAQAEEIIDGSAAVRHARTPARSAFDLLNQFNMAMRAVDIARATPLEIRHAYDEAHARIAAQICAGAYEVEWKKGGPGWLRSLLPGFKR